MSGNTKTTENPASTKATKSSLKENLEALIAGGFGGVLAVVTGHPFDLLKVRCQSGQAGSTLQALNQLFRESAALPGNALLNSTKTLYKGVVAPLVGVTPIFAVSFWGYDIGKRIVSSNAEHLTIAQLATAGFISAVPTTLVMAPIERIKVMLQTNNALQGSFLRGARYIIKTGGGFPSLFKGSLATFGRDGPGSAIYFASYEISKRALGSRDLQSSPKLSHVCISGGLAGISMWICVFPIDTIKTQLQSSSTRSLSMLEVTRDIYNKRGGIRGFYPGLGPALLRSIPANAATFLGVELVHSFFNKYSVFN